MSFPHQLLWIEFKPRFEYMRIRLLTLLIATLYVSSFGCTSDEEKIRRVVERAVKKCKEADGDFYEVEVFEGKDEVLTAACEEPIENLEILDEFHARAQTGPYDWLVGVDTETGVWVLTQVNWEVIGQARRARAGEDPPKDALRRAEEKLAEAQKALPQSEWIRLERLENIFDLREAIRAKAENPTSMGEEARKIYEETLDFAEKQEDAALEAKARLMAIDYFRNQQYNLEDSLSNIGSSDEWLESLIKQAKKDNNQEDLENYTTELEERRAKRPDKIARIEGDIQTVQKKMCEEVRGLSAGGIEDDPLKQQVTAMRKAIDCSPSALGAGGETGKETGEEDAAE